MSWTLGGGTFSNDGTISGSAQGVVISGAGSVIDTIVNNGTISASGSALQIISSGATGPIVNNGLLHSPTGIAIAAFLGAPTMGTLTNTGTIHGGIVNRTAGQLVIVGVTDGSGNYGTLTSVGRTIESTIGGLRFASGNSLVDMNMNVGLGQTVTNAGASLKFINNRTVNGNFSQTAGNLVIAGISPTVFPKLTVTGTAALTGGSIVLVPVSGGTSAGTYTIISAAAGVTNSASAVAAGYTATATVSGSNLLITLTLVESGPGAGSTPGSGGTVGSGTAAGPAASGLVWTVKARDAGGQAVPIGPVLDKLSADANFTGLLAALTVLQGPAQNRALQQLAAPAPVTQAGSSNALFSLSAGAINQRQMTVLAGLPGGKSAGSSSDGTGVWGQMLGGRASLDSTLKASGFRSSAYGLTVGGDTHLSDDVVGGGAFSWTRSDLSGNGSASGADATLNSYQLATYGTWRPNGQGLFFNGMFSVGRNNYSQARAIDFLSSTAVASYHGWQGMLKLGTGYDIALSPNLTLTPMASLQVARLKNNAYQESGAGVANLTVAGQSHKNVESEIGLKLATSTETRAGRLVADLQAGWVHSFTNQAITTTAAMGGVSFATTTDRVAPNGAHLVLRGTLKRANNLSFSLEYDGTFRSGFRSQAVAAKMRYDF